MENLSTTSTLSTLLNTTEMLNSTRRAGHSSSPFTLYISVFLIWVPGIVTNILALAFIIRDIRKAVFPAILLLLVLCMSDLLAVVFSAIRHVVIRRITVSTFGMCASLSVIHSFFKTYAGVMNSFMAVDRVLAICTPFYYKRSIDVTTWKLGCLIAAVAVLCFNCFPLFGLGSVMGVRSSGSAYCSSLSFKEDPVERVYGFAFGIIGILCVLTVVVCNAVLIRTILKLNSRIVSIKVSDTTSETNSDDKPSNSSATSFEIAFAKLMGGLATVYLVFGTPYNVLILINQLNVTVDPLVTGYIHLLGGFSYAADPIVYILIRKTNRKRILEFLCSCKKNTGDIN